MQRSSRLCRLAWGYSIVVILEGVVLRALPLGGAMFTSAFQHRRARLEAAMYSLRRRSFSASVAWKVVACVDETNFGDAYSISCACGLEAVGNVERAFLETGYTLFMTGFQQVLKIVIRNYDPQQNSTSGYTYTVAFSVSLFTDPVPASSQLTFKPR